jgi:hypothetical protein
VEVLDVASRQDGKQVGARGEGSSNYDYDASYIMITDSRPPIQFSNFGITMPFNQFKIPCGKPVSILESQNLQIFAIE